MHKFTLTQMAAGYILKKKREEMGRSQTDIANLLNLKNYNYISMLETGRSNIPTKKITSFITNYGFEQKYIKAFIKKIEPDIWDITIKILEEEIGQKYVIKLNEEADRLFVELADTYNLPETFRDACID